MCNKELKETGGYYLLNVGDKVYMKKEEYEKFIIEDEKRNEIKDLQWLMKKWNDEKQQY